MPRHAPDDIDLMCYGWAATRRAILGLGRHKRDCPAGKAAPALISGEFLPEKLPTKEKAVGTLICNCISPKERIGKLKSTLGRIRDDREGASALFLAGSQNWPEVYTGTSLLIHRAWYECPVREWMLVMDGHYVHREDTIKVKAQVIGLKEHEWFSILAMLKGYLRGYLQNAKAPDGENFVPVVKPGKTFVRLFQDGKSEDVVLRLMTRPTS